MNRTEMLDILRQAGALLEGHFQLSSGRHSNAYVQCAQILQYPWFMDQCNDGLAELFKEAEIDVVIAPAMGGVLISQGVGRALQKRALFTERDNGEMILRRNFHIESGEKVLVVEDVVTTGKSVKEVIKVVEELGGVVIGVGSFIDRSGGNADFGVPYKALLTMELVTYSPEECPMCQSGHQVTKPGSRFLSK